MLEMILGKSREYSDRAWREQQEIASHRANILDWLKPLIDFFPIGKKLRYYPEYKREVIFDTIVLGYGVNGELVYSVDSIERDSAGNPTSFRIVRNDKRIDIGDIETFQLLVPDTSHLELKLDYERRALIGRGRQFIVGNCISLTSSATGHGAASMDTDVAKHLILDDGPYAQTQLILLTPQLESLIVKDQRKKGRAKINVPVVLSPMEESQSGQGTIVDISEGAVRIRLRDASQSMPGIVDNAQLVLVINLAEAERQYTIKASVLRRSPETCVVRLDTLLQGGVFVPFNPLNHMELKSELLNYVP